MPSFDIKKRTFEFALDTINVCKTIQSEEKEFILTKQLIRSATSIGANVRESKNAQSKADFIHKLSISQKECDESLYWLELLSHTVNGDKKHILKLHAENTEILKVIRTIIMNTKENQMKLK